MRLTCKIIRTDSLGELGREWKGQTEDIHYSWSEELIFPCLANLKAILDGGLGIDTEETKCGSRKK